MQYRARVEDFDFDMTIERFSMSTTPGDAMRPSSPRRRPRPRDRTIWPASPIPAIDALIEKIIAAETRAELTIACRAFDRVFRAGRYWVPQWYRKPPIRLAYWDVFDHPPNLPRYRRRCVGAPDNLVVRRRQGRQSSSRRNSS